MLGCSDGNEAKEYRDRGMQIEATKPYRYVFLHIGKTGGTSIKTVIRSELVRDLPIGATDHKATAADIVKDEHALFGFVLRDPVTRFVSGFDSRLRNGRPEYDTPWTTGEAVAFSYFATANQLAEALFAKNQRLRSAAIFAARAITHLRRGYKFHLGELEQVKTLVPRIYYACRLETLGENAHKFVAPLGITREQFDANFKRRHVAAEKSKLSRKAVANLQQFYADEFAIYDYCVEHLDDRLLDH